MTRTRAWLTVLLATACGPTGPAPRPPAPDVGFTCGVDPQSLGALVGDRPEYIAQAASSSSRGARLRLEIATASIRFTVERSVRGFDRRLILQRELRGPRTAGDPGIFSRLTAAYRWDDLRLIALSARYYRGADTVAIDTAWSSGDTLVIARFTDLAEATNSRLDSLHYLGPVWGSSCIPLSWARFRIGKVSTAGGRS